MEILDTITLLLPFPNIHGTSTKEKLLSPLTFSQFARKEDNNTANTGSWHCKLVESPGDKTISRGATINLILLMDNVLVGSISTNTTIYNIEMPPQAVKKESEDEYLTFGNQMTVVVEALDV